MRTFRAFLEALSDPKRDPGLGRWENQPDPEDDDYTPPDPFFSDEDDPRQSYGSNKVGLTAHYPLAQASGSMRGLQTQTPEDLFRSTHKAGDTFRDRLHGRELVDTLRSKLYADEPMSSGEIDFLIRALDREYKLLDAQRKPRSV